MMKYIGMILAFVATGFILTVPVQGQLESGKSKVPRNVILMIGDGIDFRHKIVQLFRPLCNPESFPGFFIQCQYMLNVGAFHMDLLI
jgi:hypothetical protein